MENDVLQKKDPFPKTVNKASTLMANWKNKPGNYTNKYNETNYGMAFATDRKEEKSGNKNSKEKEITYFKCGKRALLK